MNTRNDSIFIILSDRRWHTLEELSTALPEYSTASISAGFRELKRHGISTKSRVREYQGRHPIWEYGLRGASGTAKPAPSRSETLKAIRGIKRSIAILERTLA